MKRTALITGATKGIGRALLEQLADAGLTVFATGRDRAELAAAKAETGALGACFDLSQPDSPSALYREAVAALGGPPDFLVNNAGVNARKSPWVDVSDAELDQHYAVNYRAPAILCREALRDMQARAEQRSQVGGHIVNVLSTVVHFANPTMGAYTAMKHGLHGLTQVLIKEARERRVKVTGVYPGGTDTSFRKQARPDYLRPEGVALMIKQVLLAPDDLVVHDLTFRPFVETNF